MHIDQVRGSCLCKSKGISLGNRRELRSCLNLARGTRNKFEERGRKETPVWSLFQWSALDRSQAFHTIVAVAASQIMFDVEKLDFSISTKVCAKTSIGSIS